MLQLNSHPKGLQKYCRYISRPIYMWKNKRKIKYYANSSRKLFCATGDGTCCYTVIITIHGPAIDFAKKIFQFATAYFHVTACQINFGACIYCTDLLYSSMGGVAVHTHTTHPHARTLTPPQTHTHTLTHPHTHTHTHTHARALQNNIKAPQYKLKLTQCKIYPNEIQIKLLEPRH
jgi:hypothetical protein